jgi:hypothetical protein
MPIPDWLPATLLGVQLAGLAYVVVLMFRIRRTDRDADARLRDAMTIQRDSTVQMARVNAFLTHLMQQHGVLHTPHAHDDPDTPTVQ